MPIRQACKVEALQGMIRCMLRKGTAAPALLGALMALPALARAATIQVTPSDSYDLIEGANPGDEVVIAPGTYRYRVYLETQASSSQPIVIRAQDPADPPVWDLSDGNVGDAPGSYDGGDNGRGCWQIAGATNILISGIEFTGCHNDSHNAAGLRYYGGAEGIVLEDCIFHDNDNGLTGGTEDSEITVEHSDFHDNGSTQASNATHNIYVYGGRFTLRYSLVRDAVQAQNFHIRAHDSVLEYNWFARARSYQGDLMTDDDYDGPGPYQQNMLLRGNVIVQDQAPNNSSQIIAIYDDYGSEGLTLSVTLVNNTLVGNGGHAALVHLSNEDGSTVMDADLANNIIYGTSVPVLVETASRATVTGSNNWIMSNADAGDLTDSVVGNDPGFADAAVEDFTLASGSTAIGAATGNRDDLPDREYYQNETVARQYRLRSSVHDIGAFESTTTSEPQGPGGAIVAPIGGAAGSNAGGAASSEGGATTGGATASGGETSAAGTENQGGASSGGRAGSSALGGDSNAGQAGSAEAAGADAGSDDGSTESAKDEGGSSGCGCRVPRRGPGAPGAWVALGLLGWCAMRRHRR